jgi:hypothetical protein
MMLNNMPCHRARVLILFQCTAGTEPTPQHVTWPGSTLAGGKIHVKHVICPLLSTTISPLEEQGY